VAAAQGTNVDEVETMFVLCHNPVAEGDHDGCGPAGTVARVGDLRYNFMWWVDQPQYAGPLGYGPSSADPETGELIAGQAFVYGAGVDTYAQYGLELIRFMNGDLDFDEISDADYIRDELRRNADPNVDPRSLVNPELANIRLDEMNIEDMLPEGVNQLVDNVRSEGLNDFAYSPEWINHRFDMIAESGLGSRLVNDEVLRAMGVSDLSEVPEEVRDQFFRGGAMMPSVIMEQRQQVLRNAANGCMLQPEYLDDTVVGIAQAYAGRTDYDQIWEEVRGLIYEGVMEHEVGHTLGLRHNFQASYDSINYFDRYWELKTAGVIGVTDEGEVGIVPFRSPNQHLYLADIYGFAQMTPDQRAGRMREYQYSSIMDYSANFNTDLHGIGKYDEAAIIYAYTTGRDRNVSLPEDHPLFNTQERGYVETFNNPGRARDTIFEGFESLNSPAYSEILETYHYSTVAVELGTSRDIAYDEDMDGEGDGALALGEAQVSPEAIIRGLSDRTLMKYDDVANARDAQTAADRSRSPTSSCRTSHRTPRVPACSTWVPIPWSSRWISSSATAPTIPSCTSAAIAWIGRSTT
jgi:hypothetical protein